MAAGDQPQTLVYHLDEVRFVKGVRQILTDLDCFEDLHLRQHFLVQGLRLTQLLVLS